MIVAVIASGAFAAEDAPPKIDEAKVEALVQQLGAEQFDERELATDALKTLGVAVVPLLDAWAAKADDPEIRLRIHRILDFLLPLKAIVESPQLTAIASIVFVLGGSISRRASRDFKLTCQWEQVGGEDLGLPAVQLAFPSVRMRIHKPGSYRFKFTVKTADKGCRPVFVDVTIKNPGKTDEGALPPRRLAEADQDPEWEKYERELEMIRKKRSEPLPRIVEFHDWEKFERELEKIRKEFSEPLPRIGEEESAPRP